MRTSALAVAAALAAMVLLAGAARAQAPSSPIPTAGRPNAAGLAYRYVAGLDGHLALGIVDRLLVNLRGDALVTTPVWGLYLEPRWTYAEVNGARTDSEWYLRAVGFLFPRDRLYGFAVGLAERSFRRQVDARLTGGAGVGSNLVRAARGDLLVAQGLAHEHTAFRVPDLEGAPDEPDRARGVVRAVTRVSGRLRVAGRTSLFLDTYLKPAIAGPGDYRILAKASLELAIAGAVVARALLDYTRETVHVAGTSTDELVVSFGIAVRRD